MLVLEQRCSLYMMGSQVSEAMGSMGSVGRKGWLLVHNWHHRGQRERGRVVVVVVYVGTGRVRRRVVHMRLLASMVTRV